MQSKSKNNKKNQMISYQKKLHLVRRSRHRQREINLKDKKPNNRKRGQLDGARGSENDKSD